MTNEPAPSLNEQILALSKLTGQKRTMLQAVRASLDLRSAIEKLHAELPPEVQLSFGVGIHYGEAVLGWIGTEKRLEYTAIGDSVNTAKRIQENAAKNQILITN